MSPRLVRLTTWAAVAVLLSAPFVFGSTSSIEADKLILFGLIGLLAVAAMWELLHRHSTLSITEQAALVGALIVAAIASGQLLRLWSSSAPFEAIRGVVPYFLFSALVLIYLVWGGAGTPRQRLVLVTTLSVLATISFSIWWAVRREVFTPIDVRYAATSPVWAVLAVGLVTVAIWEAQQRGSSVRFAWSAALGLVTAAIMISGVRVSLAATLVFVAVSVAYTRRGRVNVREIALHDVVLGATAIVITSFLLTYVALDPWYAVTRWIPVPGTETTMSLSDRGDDWETVLSGVDWISFAIGRPDRSWIDSYGNTESTLDTPLVSVVRMGAPLTLVMYGCLLLLCIGSVNKTRAKGSAAAKWFLYSQLLTLVPLLALTSGMEDKSAVLAIFALLIASNALTDLPSVLPASRRVADHDLEA